MADCIFPAPGPDGSISLAAALRVLSTDCVVPPGEVRLSTPATIYDEHGHELDGDYDPLGHHGCQHKDTPEWKAAHRKPRKKDPVMSDHNQTPPVPAPITTTAAPETLAVAVTPPPAPAVTQTTATVGVDAAVNQIKALLPAGTDASPGLLIGGAAGLAVVGAAVKMGPGLLKARAERAAEARQLEHEERMKKLEIEERKTKNQKKSEKSDDQHGACTTARLALEVRVAAAEQRSAALEARLAEVAAETKKAVSSGPSFGMEGFDPEELEARLRKLEKALKPAAPPAKKRKR